MQRPDYITPEYIAKTVEQALIEDLGGHVMPEADITATLIDADTQGKASIITREDMVLCGRAWADHTFNRFDNELELNWHAQDGDAVKAGATLVDIRGNARAILIAERTALNFLQTLSGTATQTQRFTALLMNNETKLLDTRKTLPGLRLAQKYAVLCGGGSNHRIGLFDAFLIKENHILACGGIEQAVNKARQIAPNKPVEVEVENIDEFEQALAAGADVIMLDNFPLHLIQQAVEKSDKRCKLEVSGNIIEEDLKVLALAGVDYISSGALTKHVKAIDLSLRIALN